MNLGNNIWTDYKENNIVHWGWCDIMMIKDTVRENMIDQLHLAVKRDTYHNIALEIYWRNYT